MRHKETHFVNMPSYANKVVEFAMTVLTDKLKNRVAVRFNESGHFSLNITDTNCTNSCTNP